MRLAVSEVQKNGFFFRGKDGGCFVRGRVGVEEALVRGVREKPPDALQTLGFEEALDGKTRAGQGTWEEEETLAAKAVNRSACLGLEARRCCSQCETEVGV